MVRNSLAVAALLAVVTVPVAAHAGPNLLTNGSFEAGGGSFTGWTIGGTFGVSPGNGPTIFLTDGSTPGEYGDVVPPDSAASASPDAAGTHAAYFVDDDANETLSQSITLVGGQTYAVGFDYYETTSGAANINPFTLTASLGADDIATVTDSSAPTATWTNASDDFTAPTSGSYTFTFDFVSGAQPAKDVLVDKVFVTTAVPEPFSLALLGSGLVSLGVARRRRRAG